MDQSQVPQPAQPNVQTAAKVPGPMKYKRRHRGIMVSFLLFVLVPFGLAVAYLYVFAADQYASRVGFSVRSEEVSSQTELLGGLKALSTGMSKDADVLYEYISSQKIVELVDEKLDLGALYSKPQNDPVFQFNPEGTIEDLVDYWGRMVKTDYDAGTGLIEIRVNAFAPDDAQAIAQEIFSASSDLVNRLSAIARDDITRYSREELNNSVDLLKSARQAMARFRNETKIVDPSADIAGQMGLLTSLQEQLSEALIEIDLLVITTRVSDPRIRDLERKIEVIRKRIEEERQRFGLSTNNSTENAFSALLAEYEAIAIDQSFAEESYLLARAAYNNALAQSRRQSRYLAAYVEPTLAQRAEYPQRALLVFLTAFFLGITWLIGVLFYYSLRDRK